MSSPVPSFSASSNEDNLTIPLVYTRRRSSRTPILSTKFKESILSTDTKGIYGGYEPSAKRPRMAIQIEESDSDETTTERFSGPDLLKLAKQDSFTYSASPVLTPEMREPLLRIWEENKDQYSYRQTKELKRIKNCVKDMKDDATDNYAKSIYVRDVDPIKGKGCFTNRSFKKHEIIGEYAGFISKLRPSDKLESSVKSKDYLFEFPDTPFDIVGSDSQDIGNFTRYINHADDSRANVSSVEYFDYIPTEESKDGFPMVIPRVLFITEKDLYKGEELLYEYCPQYWKERNIYPI